MIDAWQVRVVHNQAMQGSNRKRTKVIKDKTMSSYKSIEA